ncbi:hypothetical protein B0H10DRAFT_2240215 [Mycena sp. CBHHK59/15]|nr:hypothetical protein B0H10DRAFT_2240215 [Mycena sp. CBHHK59/15]
MPRTCCSYGNALARLRGFHIPDLQGLMRTSTLTPFILYYLAPPRPNSWHMDAGLVFVCVDVPLVFAAVGRAADICPARSSLLTPTGTGVPATSSFILLPPHPSTRPPTAVPNLPAFLPHPPLPPLPATLAFPPTPPLIVYVHAEGQSEWLGNVEWAGACSPFPLCFPLAGPSSSAPQHDRPIAVFRPGPTSFRRFTHHSCLFA